MAESAPTRDPRRANRGLRIPIGLGLIALGLVIALVTVILSSGG